MRGSSKPDIKDFKSEREAFDALTVGKANMITTAAINIAQISFQAMISSKGFRNHIDDCVQLK
jgi:hypothetical protein